MKGWLDESTLSFVSSHSPPRAGLSQGGRERVRVVLGSRSDAHVTSHRMESVFSTTESGAGSPRPTQPDPLEAFPQRSLEAGDIAVLALYFLFVLAVGLWVSQPGGSRAGKKLHSKLYILRNAVEVDSGSGAKLGTSLM